MKNTRYIQRLKAPQEGFLGKGNPFAFGGGIPHGGLTDEAYAAISQIFSFDYMGSAEFEHGAVAQSIGRIASYCREEKTLSIIKKRDPYYKTGSIDLKGKHVYYLCNVFCEEDVKRFLTNLPKGGEEERNLKEYSYFKENLEGKDVGKNVVGWLELDNDFMFFTDQNMYAKTLQLFDVKKENGK
jgi:hypothetical protein